MMGQLRLLHIAGAAKAKPRTVVLVSYENEVSNKSLKAPASIKEKKKKQSVFLW